MPKRSIRGGKVELIMLRACQHSQHVGRRAREELLAAHLRELYKSYFRKVWIVSLLCACDTAEFSTRQSAREPQLARVAHDSRTVDSSSARLRLGERLFSEKSVSLDSTLACATCHIPTRAFTESLATSRGIGVLARSRNAPSLLDVAVQRANFDWDGRASTLEDQLRGVFSVTGDMGLDVRTAVARLRTEPAYDSLFVEAYGRVVDEEALFAAIVAYQKSLSATGSRFNRFYLGGDSTALSAQEKRGWLAFKNGKFGCAGCHNAIPDPGRRGTLLFQDGRFHNLGVGYEKGRMLDLGRYAVTNDSLDWGAFKTPTLNNVALTAPYMHDGSIPTLEEVVDFYARGGVRNPNLDPVVRPLKMSRKDRDDLVSFMRSLSEETLTTAAPTSK